MVEQSEQQRQGECQRLQSTLQRRRISELRRSPAFDSPYLPGKQTSSPLPGEKQRRKIYERDHTVSRSWNPERYDYEEIEVDELDQEIVASEDRAMHIALPVAEPYTDPFQDRICEYEQESSEMEYADPRRSSVRITVQDPAVYGRKGSLYDGKDLCRRQIDSKQRQLVARHQFNVHLKPNNEVSQKCLELWADRRSLEVQQAQQQSSTEQSASTSFESNTEPIPCDPLDSRRRSGFLELPQTAVSKRQKYKNLLLHRKSDRDRHTPIHIYGNSLDSALSTDSNVSMVVNIGTFSTDSNRSDQTVNSFQKSALAQNLRRKAAPGFNFHLVLV
ncbi:unnamed protein product [Gongylonema pulchrum]|uniref:Uncharacterized protein n=1 Tax=Gongylonema pulchrum TaxID=637853 RepID=A0A183DVY1_9BILA|nr:unnamed protein product [Gongylonema pulchrum]